VKAFHRSYGFLAVFVLLAVVPAAAAFKYVEVGQEAPDFSLPQVRGEETIQLQERLGKKALALVFWATWSPRSQTMLDDLNALYLERKAQGFAVLAVNVEHEEVSAEERKAIEELASGWSFPVVIDESLRTYHTYGVVATPSLALLDEAGLVRFVRASYSTSARIDIQEAVDSLLGLVAADAPKMIVKKRDYVPPKRATLHYQKAEVLIRRGMAKRAIRDLEKAAKLDPKWAEPRVLLARIYRAEARKKPRMLAKAETVLRETRELQPKHVQTLASLADILVATGKSQEAFDTAEQALALEPAYTPALVAKARSLRALGRLEEALKTLEEALELDPRNPDIFAEKGEAAAARGQWQEAAGALRKAVDLVFAARLREG
jgi:tetratricopeptide (TPR) repeat protein